MKVLVVDADQLFARLIRTKLESWGHTVAVEHDGDAGLARITKEPFRMVILERDLPGMDGLELVRRVRKLHRPRYTYVIFYTARADDDSLVNCLEAGADEYLIKPLNTVELHLLMKARKRQFNVEDMLREAGGDAATGVVNIGSFREFFRVALAQAKQRGTQGALLYVDVSNYRDVQASHGYGPAEALMAEIARLLRRLTGDGDLIGRIADDCYCIMLQNIAAGGHGALADTIESHAESIAIVVDDGSVRPVITLGVLEFPQADLSHLQILDDLDPARYGRSQQAQAAAPADRATSSS